jgi:hypothetical protein
MRRCPADEIEHDAWADREVLAGCIRLVRAGNRLTDEAVSEGLKLAADTLTVSYVFGRYGFSPPEENENGGRRHRWEPGPLDEFTLLRARAAMVEAARNLRRKPLPLYACVDHLATMGMTQDVSDEAPGFKNGEMAPTTAMWPPRKQWERFNPDAKV